MSQAAGMSAARVWPNSRQRFKLARTPFEVVTSPNDVIGVVVHVDPMAHMTARLTAD